MATGAGPQLVEGVALGSLPDDTYDLIVGMVLGDQSLSQRALKARLLNKRFASKHTATYHSLDRCRQAKMFCIVAATNRSAFVVLITHLVINACLAPDVKASKHIYPFSTQLYSYVCHAVYCNSRAPCHAAELLVALRDLAPRVLVALLHDEVLSRADLDWCVHYLHRMFVCLNRRTLDRESINPVWKGAQVSRVLYEGIQREWLNR